MVEFRGEDGDRGAWCRGGLDAVGQGVANAILTTGSRSRCGGSSVGFGPTPAETGSRAAPAQPSRSVAAAASGMLGMCATMCLLLEPRPAAAAAVLQQVLLDLCNPRACSFAAREPALLWR